jgi:hypothetical protein
MKPKWKWICLVSAILLIFGVSGCVTPQPFAYKDDRDEKPGPGLFSGDEGGFVIYGRTPENSDTTGEPSPETDSQ